MNDPSNPLGLNTAKPGPGATRAAAVLVGLGQQIAASIFQQLAESDVRRVASGAKELRSLPPAAVTEALTAFIEAMEKVGAEAAAGDMLLREVAAKTLGGDLARRAFDGVVPPPPPDEVLGPVAQADPESLAMVLAREQAQTIALVLSSIDPERAARTMEHIPEAQRPFILRRMASVEAVAPEVLREVGQALASELQAVVAGGMRKVDGKNVALEILRRSPSEQQREVVTEIEKDDPNLAAELRSRLFTFGDLVNLTDRDIQTLLKEIESTQLTMALKGASPELKDKLLKNMSSRAAQMLADDLAALGPVKLSAVESAQNAVVKVALDLSEQGRVTIVRPTDKML
jgi:flagellar motor switch protein FliG